MSLLFLGFIFDIFGVYDVAFYTAAVIGVYICVTTTFAAVLVKRRKKHDAETKMKYKEVE
jgi:hypothetical protein